MKWSQFKSPLFYMCLADAEEASWSLTQEVASSNNPLFYTFGENSS